MLEVLSEQTERVDRDEKRHICRRMGVAEFWLFDPRKATRALEGWRLDAAGRYQPIAADRDGALDSTVLETRLRGHAYRLEWWDWELDDWYTVEKQVRAESHADILVESLMGVAKFYLDAERLELCRTALQSQAWENLPSVETLMQALTAAPVPAAAVESVLRGTSDARPAPDES